VLIGVAERYEAKPPGPPLKAEPGKEDANGEARGEG